jgi:type IV secretory pathway VirJ component
MTRVTGRQGSRNDGIQATIVRADVIAVGQNAQATKHVAAEDSQALLRAVGQLRQAIAGLELQPGAREVLEQDVRSLAESAQSGHQDKSEAKRHLDGIADKLKMIGVVVSEAAGLAEPLVKIANLLGISLPFLAGG